MPSRNTRKNRGSRRNRRNRRQYGGTQTFSPSPVGVSLAGSSPSTANLAQGGQYASFHANQHGGMAPYPGGVTDTLLSQDLQASARVLPLNGYLADIRHVRDPGQAGGRRRSRNSRGRFTSKRRGAKRSRKTHGSKRSRKTRAKRNSHGRFLKMRGGAAVSLANASDYGAPGMLLPASIETKAVNGMNPEWKLAADPTSFAPRT